LKAASFVFLAVTVLFFTVPFLSINKFKLNVAV
jgi:hypothetical protein